MLIISQCQQEQVEFTVKMRADCYFHLSQLCISHKVCNSSIYTNYSGMINIVLLETRMQYSSKRKQWKSSLAYHHVHSRLMYSEHQKFGLSTILPTMFIELSSYNYLAISCRDKGGTKIPYSNYLSD